MLYEEVGECFKVAHCMVVLHVDLFLSSFSMHVRYAHKDFNLLDVHEDFY
jgi:hypothetical protein